MGKRSVFKKTLDLLEADSTEVLRAVVNAPYWPKGLEINKSYTRLGDDTSGEISVVIANDADTWITVHSKTDPEEFGLSHRFRSGFGGGESLRVRNALLALALAIKLDNEEHPQNHRRKISTDISK